MAALSQDFRFFVVRKEQFRKLESPKQGIQGGLKKKIGLGSKTFGKI